MRKHLMWMATLVVLALLLAIFAEDVGWVEMTADDDNGWQVLGGLAFLGWAFVWFVCMLVGDDES